MDTLEYFLGALRPFIAFLVTRSQIVIHNVFPSPVSLLPTTKSKRDLRKLVAPEDVPYISPIGYAYDPVPEAPYNIDVVPLSFPRLASKDCEHISQNTVRLYPREAGLPYRSRFDLVRGNKFWKANLDETRTVLRMIAEHNSTTEVELGNGLTLAQIAKKQLGPGLEHRMVIATSYMFPGANERRVRIIAVLMIMYFVFDGKSL
jgi:hypothetical protein